MDISYQEAQYSAYRAFFQQQDHVQACRVIRFTNWALLPLALFDLMFHDLGWLLAGLLAARLSLALYSWWLLRQLNQAAEPEWRDRQLQNWLVGLMVMQLVSDALLPADYFGQYAINIWACLMVFIVVPLPLFMLRRLVSCYVILSLLLMLLKHPPYFAYPLSVALMLPVSAITGHAIASYVHHYRRKLLGAETELEYQEATDTVTGARNWRAFQARIQAELKRHQRGPKCLSLVIVSVGNWKQQTDRYGPEAGDMIMAEVARRLQRVMRPYDMLGRYSMDSFCLLLPESGQEDVQKIAQRTRATIAAMPVNAGGRELSLKVCIGLSSMQDGDDAQSLLGRAADACLYEQQNSAV